MPAARSASTHHGSPTPGVGAWTCAFVPLPAGYASNFGGTSSNPGQFGWTARYNDRNEGRRLRTAEAGDYARRAMVVCGVLRRFYGFDRNGNLAGRSEMVRLCCHCSYSDGGVYGVDAVYPGCSLVDGRLEWSVPPQT